MLGDRATLLCLFVFFCLFFHLCKIRTKTMFAVTGVAGRTVTGVGCLQVDALRTSVTNAIRRGTIIHSFYLFLFLCFVFECVLFVCFEICQITRHPHTHHFRDGQVEEAKFKDEMIKRRWGFCFVLFYKVNHECVNVPCARVQDRGSHEEKERQKKKDKFVC